MKGGQNYASSRYSTYVTMAMVVSTLHGTGLSVMNKQIRLLYNNDIKKIVNPLPNKNLL